MQERLTREVTYWDHRASELQLQADAGKSPRMNPDRAAARADELQRRKEARLAELDREAQLASQSPGCRRRTGAPGGSHTTGNRGTSCSLAAMLSTRPLSSARAVDAYSAIEAR